MERFKETLNMWKRLLNEGLLKLLLMKSKQSELENNIQRVLQKQTSLIPGKLTRYESTVDSKCKNNNATPRLYFSMAGFLPLKPGTQENAAHLHLPHCSFGT